MATSASDPDQAAGIRRWASRSRESARGSDTAGQEARRGAPSPRRKEATSIAPPTPQRSCQPDGPPSQHSCSSAERNFSPSGTGWGHSRWGLVWSTGTMESGSPWLLPSTWPRTWLCPSEHTSGAARPKGQGRESTWLAEAATQMENRPAHRSKWRLWLIVFLPFVQFLDNFFLCNIYYIHNYIWYGKIKDRDK